MELNFLTLFPQFYQIFQNESIVKRAIEKKLISINVINFRQFSDDKHQKVDDQIYGGGAGMLLKVEPIDKALENLKGLKILLTPQGQKFNQKLAQKLAKEKTLTFIAGHYEGFDERVRSLVDLEVSIGDYVLTGGELPSMVIADAIIRLIPGVIKLESHQDDSFSNHLLEYPQYTRPREYKGMKVPEVLFSGNHQAIEQWRKIQAEQKTQQKRPDLANQKCNPKNYPENNKKVIKRSKNEK